MKPAVVSNYVLGLVPPQAVELEEAVLGAMMLEKEALVLVDGLISEKIFYKDSHKCIYQAIRSLNSEGKPVDLLTVSQELRRIGKLEDAGGAFYVTELTSKVASAANIEYHARILQEMYMKRRAIQVAAELQRLAFDDTSDAFELMEMMQSATLETLHDIDNGKTVLFGESLSKRLQVIAKRVAEKKTLTGVDTGFKSLNELTGGWQKPDLIIVAGRPAMGKTSFALCLVRNAAMAGVPVAIFSLEMSEDQLVDRLISIETEIASAQDLQRGNISQEQFTGIIHKTAKASKYPIYIDDTAGISISQLRSKAYKLKATKGIGMIVIDYLQLMSGEGKGNREQEISQISRGLKKIAKELDIPVIALSQLSRSVEQRGGDKKPQLSDLRESGAIEQDADIVIFTHRPEYYGITEYSDGSSTRGVAEIIFAKHRNGALDTAMTRFVGQFTKFKEMSDFETQSPIEESKYANAFRSGPTPEF